MIKDKLQHIPWKKVGLTLLFPHTFIVFLLVNLTIVGLLYIFVNQMEANPIAAVFYAVAFYSLVVVCARIPAIVKKTQKGVYANKYANRYLTDKDLRMRVSMYRGLIINLVFAIFKVILGVISHSAWLYAMAAYNVILSVMRSVVVLHSQKKGLTEEEEQKRNLHTAWVCGWLMLLLNVAISAIMYMVIVLKQTIVYHEIVVIALAAYTFYCFTMAIVNVVKYNKRNMMYSIVKRIDLAKAIVSIFTMQVAMLTQFGQDGDMDIGMMNTMTGIAVTISINTIAAFMLHKVSKTKRDMLASGE